MFCPGILFGAIGFFFVFFWPASSQLSCICPVRYYFFLGVFPRRFQFVPASALPPTPPPRVRCMDGRVNEWMAVAYSHVHVPESPPHLVRLSQAARVCDGASFTATAAPSRRMTHLWLLKRGLRASAVAVSAASLLNVLT